MVLTSVGRTLLSVAVDLGFGVDLALQSKLKINFKGDGQECPSYTSQQRSIQDDKAR